MNDEITKSSATEIEVAKMLGARQAFGLVAGRCSAADAAILRNIRDNKKYLSFAPNWADFCEEHLRMSKSNANRLIRLLSELGPAYFTMAQLTGITPDEFRRLAPSVKDNALEFRGEAIALIEENAGRLTEAVGALRQAEEPEAPASDPHRAKLDRIEDTMLKSLKLLLELASDKEAQPRATAVMETINRELVLTNARWPVPWRL
ncbi:MAG TPA: hypothetical protein VKX45_15390 [Bryobacteraceae bacterium]|nr:hypothetical protein [Bryobacteraceae bacterium]